MKTQSVQNRVTRQARHEGPTLSLSNGKTSRAPTRRTLIAGLGAAAAAMRPFGALATFDVGPEIAVVYTCDPMGAQQPQRRGLTAGLIELGFAPGNKFELYNWGLYGAFDAASDLIRSFLGHGLICTVGQAAALAAREEARIYKDLRVVTLDCTDAVEAGLVDSLEAPGGNVTGLNLNDPTPQLIRLAHDLVPGAASVGMVINVSNPLHTLHVAHAQRDTRGIRLVRADLTGPDGIETAFDRLEGEGVDAIVVPADEVLAQERVRVITRAKTAGVPTLYGSAGDAEAGGLAAHYTETAEMARSAARYVTAIMSGTHPGDLPMETGPNALAINLITAREQGIEFPLNILERADVMIQ